MRYCKPHNVPIANSINVITIRQKHEKSCENMTIKRVFIRKDVVVQKMAIFPYLIPALN